jgi:hypothetical protein
MKNGLLESFRRHEIYVVATVIGVVFVAAMGLVAWMLRSSMSTPPYEALTEEDLKRVFATAYLRYREDDGSPYLKVEMHNGTLWWIKKVEYEFEGHRYSLTDADAFQPLHFGALRTTLKKAPPVTDSREYDLKIIKAYGYPPASVQLKRTSRTLARNSRTPRQID